MKSWLSLGNRYGSSRRIRFSDNWKRRERSGRAPSTTNVLIGVPCFGGNIQYHTVNMLMSLSSSLSNAKIPHQTHFIAGESLITRARNHLASIATFSNDSAGRPFSHLMFVDADISFHPEFVFKMLKANLPIVALPYSLKSLNWRCFGARQKRPTYAFLK